MDGFTRVCLRRDAELLDEFNADQAVVPGFLSALAEAGAIPVPLLAAHGEPGGPLMRETFHVLVTELVHRLAARLPVNGVLLALHGAMAIEDEPDAAAEILERVRNVLPRGVPIGVALHPPSLDTAPMQHSRVTARMQQPGVFFVACRDDPRPDLYGTGRRTAGRLLELLGEQAAPLI